QRRSMALRVLSSAPFMLTPNTSMVPERFGISPRMVRVSTDLPAPEGPTKPRISPRFTSRLSLSRISLSPNPTVRSRTRIIASLAAAISDSDRGEEDGENAVDDDHEEDRLHHRGRRVLAERFRAAPYRRAFDAGDDADD